MTTDGGLDAPRQVAELPEPAEPDIAGNAEDSEQDAARRRWWRRIRWICYCLAILALFLIIGMVQSTASRDVLSPDNPQPRGSRAIAALLDQHGVAVSSSRDIDDALIGGEDRTVVIVPGSGEVSRTYWRRLADDLPAHIVLVTPGPVALEELVPPVLAAGRLTAISREPGCDLPAAQRAGPIEASGRSYSTDTANAAVVGCYSDGVNFGLLRYERDGRIIDVVGMPAILTNESLAAGGNAALALNLLGTHPQLTWVLPRQALVGDGGDSKGAITPDWVRYAAWMSAIAVLVTAIWRGRRLGPVVVEPLPVVVRASETTEGRARLYRRARARDRAAQTLRESARGSARRRLGLGRDPDRQSLVAAVAGQTGQPEPHVDALLFGHPPASDSDLLALARELDDITREVRHL